MRADKPLRNTDTVEGSQANSRVAAVRLATQARVLPAKFAVASWKIISGKSGPEYEVRRAGHAQRRPEIVKLQGLAHIEHGERHEDRECDDLLHDLQLAERQRGVADAVRRYLQKIFEQRDAPTRDRGDPPRTSLHVAQVPVPGEGHEEVGTGQEDRGAQRRMLQHEGRHGRKSAMGRCHYRRLRRLSPAPRHVRLLPRRGDRIRALSRTQRPRADTMIHIPSFLIRSACAALLCSAPLALPAAAADARYPVTAKRPVSDTY